MQISPIFKLSDLDYSTKTIFLFMYQKVACYFQILLAYVMSNVHNSLSVIPRAICIIPVNIWPGQFGYQYHAKKDLYFWFEIRHEFVVTNFVHLFLAKSKAVSQLKRET